MKMSENSKKIKVIKKPGADDVVVKEALAIAKNFKVLTYNESYAILKPQLKRNNDNEKK